MDQKLRWWNRDDWVWSATTRDYRKFIVCKSAAEPETFELLCDGVKIGESFDPDTLRKLAEDRANAE